MLNVYQPNESIYKRDSYFKRISVPDGRNQTMKRSFSFTEFGG